MTTVPHKLAVLLHKLKEADCAPIRREGPEYRCRCPAHADNGPSLYLRLTADRILIRCGGGCSAEAVCERLDHAMADLFLAADEREVDADAGLGILDPEASAAPAGDRPRPRDARRRQPARRRLPRPAGPA